MACWRVPTGLATAAGLVLGGCLAGWATAGGWCAVGALGLLAGVFRHRLGSRGFWVVPALVLGAAAGGLRTLDPPPPFPALDPATVHGRILRWETGRRGVRCLLEVWALNGTRLDRPRRVRVFADTGWESKPRSSWLRVTGRLVPNRGVTTPGAYAPRELAGVLLAERLRPPVWGPRGPAFLLRARIAVDRRIQAALPGFPGRFARAVVLGNPRALVPEEREMFRRTGTSHLTAVSGLHVGLVAMLAGLLLSGTPLWFRFAAMALLAWGYAGLAGWAASAIRAAALVAAAALGSIARRPRSPAAWLALAVPWLLWSDPGLMHAVSFQLSVGAVAGILLALETTGMVRTSRFRWLAPVGVSLGAQWGTLPSVIRAFGSLAPASLLPNLAVVPLAGLFLPAALLALIPVPGAGLFQDAAVGIAVLVRKILFVADLLPFWTRIPPPHPLVIAAFPAIALTWFSSPPRLRGRRGFRAASLLAMTGAAAACFLPLDPPRGPWCAFLDVGQADAAVCRLSDGTVWLIDVGDDRGPADAAVLTILPFLRNRRITAVDGLVISHRHRDHVGALASLLERIPVRGIYDAGYGSGGGTPAWVDSVCWARGRVPCLVAAGDTLHGGSGCSIVAVHPPAGDPGREPPGGNLNEASLMVRLVDGRFSVLLAGDGEHRAEAACLEGTAELRAGVLKVGHHGSRTSSSVAFLEAVSPEQAVISCGAGNRFGHPAPETLETFKGLGIPAHRTDREGTLLIRMAEGGLRVETFPPRAPRFP